LEFAVMVKRTTFASADCPVARSLDAIGDWWSLLIIRDAFDGVRRFSEFQTGLGIAKGMLSTRLRDLVARGVMTTMPASDGSAYREYGLTERGASLFLVIVALRQWGEDHLYGPGEAHSMLVDKERGQMVARLQLQSRTGKPLAWTDTRVRKADHKPDRGGRRKAHERAAIGQRAT
jgi:DNA-binding HxlR family transcriptional regulator